MKFYSIRELRAETKEVCDSVQKKGEAIITNNGKPTVLMLNITEDNYELVLRAVRQAKAMIAFNQMREIAANNGYMSEEEIEAEIAAARSDRKKKAESVTA